MGCPSLDHNARDCGFLPYSKRCSWCQENLPKPAAPGEPIYEVIAVWDEDRSVGISGYWEEFGVTARMGEHLSIFFELDGDEDWKKPASEWIVYDAWVSHHFWKPCHYCNDGIYDTDHIRSGQVCRVCKGYGQVEESRPAAPAVGDFPQVSREAIKDVGMKLGSCPPAAEALQTWIKQQFEYQARENEMLEEMARAEEIERLRGEDC